jgi:flavorubredoxin
MAHFDGNTTFTTVPDEGMPLTVGGYKLEVLPAHYLHSPGNLCVYDAKAKVLFSGDIGASLVDTQHLQSIYVQDFESHIQHMAGFHRRWMGSNEAKVAWVHMVRQLQVDLLVPQHGLIFRGDNVRKFLDWFEALPVSGGLAAYEQALHRLKLRPMMP